MVEQGIVVNQLICRFFCFIPKRYVFSYKSAFLEFIQLSRQISGTGNACLLAYFFSGDSFIN